MVEERNSGRNPIRNSWGDVKRFKSRDSTTNSYRTSSNKCRIHVGISTENASKIPAKTTETSPRVCSKTTPELRLQQEYQFKNSSWDFSRNPWQIFLEYFESFQKEPNFSQSRPPPWQREQTCLYSFISRLSKWKLF